MHGHPEDDDPKNKNDKSPKNQNDSPEIFGSGSK